MYLKDEVFVNDILVLLFVKDIFVFIEIFGDFFSRVYYLRFYLIVVIFRLLVDGKVIGNDDRERKFRDFKGMFKGLFKRKVIKVNN